MALIGLVRGGNSQRYQSRSAQTSRTISERIAENRARRLAIAEAMKREAGVAGHTVNRKHEDLTGLAWLETGHIRSPQGRNMAQLYILAHECGHIFLHGDEAGRRLPTHVMEMEAESYAHQAFREHGMEAPRRMTEAGRAYVGSWVAVDRSRGVPIDPRVVDYVAGLRSPYEQLRAVPDTWRLHSGAQGHGFLRRLRRLARSRFVAHLRDWFHYIWDKTTLGFALSFPILMFTGDLGAAKIEDMIPEGLPTRLAACVVAGLMFACVASAIRAHLSVRE
ncbi:MAG: hypothetical protein KGP27_08670 [Hyphomicrobiales bacterium]|nr:hypothetical protein [Hyphomicrobiales bacterium]